ncbi:heterokaryon incompatibility protein-domain-containing protein [Microdochium trichocladiopsis]|uniref:Heterokaryon incompatibility protein-domain-containing protein n=1 Tax=Microdochium trichocladiopsis TaxID=1682393 RepID=A0A9P9BLD9_9PEZI|nr:heterokaryon incompatibility protein-domain-containing protein [Microdochium trichocladiopsis]KAH7024822.1 heterokaryon incompatibility protein-domain-containing protein [Microdochium trichocladiopsis]
MRLLHTKDYHFEEKNASEVQYAILSHTWGPEEILFEDVARSEGSSLWESKQGAAKVRASCAFALAEGFEYIWIDTCCIDKSNSVELSEAINSMYECYQLADVCYAYLADVQRRSDLASSRWFTRGWTLQELIAPPMVKFLNSSWALLGTRGLLASQVEKITSLPKTLLTDRKGYVDWIAAERVLQTTSIANRMSWAAKRVTTRREDLAYCLMGIFGVNMPLIYGEGGAKAFTRLQEQIMRQSGDQSILAHGSRFLLAKDPQLFIGGISIINQYRQSAINMAGNELVLDVTLIPCTTNYTESGGTCLAVLNCTFHDPGYFDRLALVVQCVDEEQRRYRVLRGRSKWIVELSPRHPLPRGPSTELSDGWGGCQVLSMDMAGAYTARISLEIYDYERHDYSIHGSMVVQLQVVPSLQDRYEVVSSLPAMTGNYILAKCESNKDEAAHITGSDEDRQWLGTILLSKRAIITRASVGVDPDDRIVLLWGRFKERNTSGGLPSKPWCQLARAASIQKYADDMIFVDHARLKPEDRIEKPPWFSKSTDVFEQLEELPYDPSFMLWYEAAQRSKPIISHFLQALEPALMDAASEAQGTSSLKIGNDFEMVASIEPTTYLGSTVYTLQLKEQPVQTDGEAETNDCQLKDQEQP